MSAESTYSKLSLKGTSTTFSFKQEVPIPTYLLALVIGRLESRYGGKECGPSQTHNSLAFPARSIYSDLSPRSRVWAEPETIERAAFEFKEVCGV